ncbi:MAG TPA: amidohydrolase family protein [Steroidobacteraceae bacterium]|nr:amidohydrolase family protein [Steroidobacteraceae bacterium]
MIFDSHAHLVSDDFERYPPAPLSGTLDRPLDDPMTAEKLLRLMDGQGVGRAVAVQRAHVYGYDNRYVCDAADKYPDRLVAVCCIDAATDDAAARARHWLAERAAAGLRLTEPYKGSGIGWFAAPAARAVWRVAEEMGASICLHMYRWNRDETLEALPPVLTAFPRVTVIIDHASNLIAEQGSPDYGVDSALARLARFPAVYQKFTAINFARLAGLNLPLAPVVARVVKEFGAERVMWGSDVAQSAGAYADLVAMAKASTAELTAAQRQCVLNDTAAGIYTKRR